MAFAPALSPTWTISEILRQNEQRRALGQTGLTQPQVEAGIQGALEATYQGAMAQARSAREAELAQQKIDMEEKAIKAQQTGSMIGTAIQAPMSAAVTYGMGKQLGWWGAGKGAAGAAAGPATTTTTPGVANALPFSSYTGAATAGGAAGAAGVGAGTATALTPEAIATAADMGVAGGLGAAGATEAAAIGAEAGAATAGAASTAGTAGAMSVLGPIGLAVGGGLMLYSLFSDDTVICSELRRQGHLSEEICRYDSLYGATLDREAYHGYLLIFSPIARRMRRSRLLTAIVRPFGVATATEMASRVNKGIRGTTIGKVILKVGIPFCRTVYRICYLKEMMEVDHA